MDQFPIIAALLIFLVTASIPVWVQARAGRLNPFRPDLFVSICFTMYTVPVPLDVLFWGNSFNLESQNVIWVLLLSAAALLFFQTGFHWRFFPSNRVVQRSTLWIQRTLVPAWLPWVIILIGGAAFLYYIVVDFGGIDQYIFVADRHARFTAAEGRGYLTIGSYVLNTGWLLLFSRGLSRRKETGVVSLVALHLLVFSAYSMFFLLTGDRRNFVFLGLGLAFVFVWYRGMRLVRWSVSLVALLFILHLFSRVRGYAATPWLIPTELMSGFQAEWFNLAHGELGAQFLVAATLLTDIGFEDLRLGATYIVSVFHLIPDVLLAAPELAPTQWYSSVYHPRSFAVGGGVGFSFVGEAYLNFSYWGPPLVGFLAGIAARQWYRITLMRSATPLAVALYGAALPAMYMMVRADFASLLQLVIYAAVLPIFFAWSILLAFSAVARRRGAGHATEVPRFLS